MAICPHCDAEINSLYYNCSTSGWETGSVNYVPDSHGREGDVDFNYDDSGTDDMDNYAYTCPECSAEISIPGNDVTGWFFAAEKKKKPKKELLKAPNTLGNFPKRKKSEVL